MVSFTREEGQSKLYEDIIVKGKVDTISKAFAYAVCTYQNQDCLGTRQILGITIVMSPNVGILRIQSKISNLHQIMIPVTTL